VKDTALLLVDIQKGFDDLEYWGGERNNPQAEENCKVILEKFRELDYPVIHIQHSSQYPDSPLHINKPGFELKNIVHPLPTEPVIQKNVNSAFVGTNLQGKLERMDITRLVIVGLTTDHCISTTVRMAGNFGFDTYVVSDATATFSKTGIKGERYSAEIIHLTALASLKDEFTDVVATEELFKILE
jgi:nicotinamidase-related amidase